MKNKKGVWVAGYTPWGSICSVYVINNKIIRARFFGSEISPKGCKIMNPKSKEDSS